MNGDNIQMLIWAALVFIGIVGGCDRSRINFLEEDRRDHFRRIMKLDAEISELRSSLIKTDSRITDLHLKIISMKVGAE